MVLTRKRSCSEQGSSSSECGAPRDKVKRGDCEDPAAGTPRGAAAAAPGTPNTRTRRCTDTAVSTPPPRKTRSGRNTTTHTPGKLLTDSHVEDRLAVTTVSLKKASILLKDVFAISPAVTPRRSSRRISGGDPNHQDTPIVPASAKGVKDAESGEGTPAGTTPVRRSRRLSAGRAEDNTTQQIPSKLSFSIARIIGNEGESSDEGTKNQRSLSIIKEDVEQPDTKHSVAQPEPKDSGARPEPKKSEPENQSQIASHNDNQETQENQETQDSLLATITTPAKYGTASPSAPQAEKATPSCDSGTEDCRETPSPDSTAIDQTQTSPSDSAAADQMKKEIKHEEEESTDSDESSTELPSAKVDLQTTEDPKKEGNEPEKLERNQKIEVFKLTKQAQGNIQVRPDSHGKKASPALCTADENTSSSEGVTCSLGSEEEKKVEVTNGHCDENANTENEVTSTSSFHTVAIPLKKVCEDDAQLEQKMEHFRKVPRGLPVSGRWWKKEKQRFRTVYKDATGKKSWAKKMQIKRQREDTLARSAAIEAEKQKKRDDLKERQRINKIRREENAKKSEIVQVIKDPRKIKKMKRKQLRYIQTRDTTSLTTV